MAILNIKNIINKKNPAGVRFLLLLEQIEKEFCIEDLSGKVIAGATAEAFAENFPVKVEGETIGRVKANKQTALIADLLSAFAEKELEKKKLGNEVLSLYREVNQIFNFSDKLAQSIGAPSIAATALEEAGHVIRYDTGAVILWNEENQRLELIAAKGENLFNEEIINNHREDLLGIILGGQSEIINEASFFYKKGYFFREINSIVYAALKVEHRIMGAIILASATPNQYVAADLKLLITFALQCSAAIESALLYEKNIRELRESENAMRRIYNAAEKFVPYAFINSLGHKLITDVKLGDQVEKEVTVLFTDIREFATLSEKMTPEENFGFICLFNERMGPIIRRHNGFINQYLGDAIMAIFPGEAADALAAAIEMQQAVMNLNNQRHLNNYPNIRIGIGMHTGPLIMGITGDDERLDAATISDTVNTASRIENLTKHFKADILLTEASCRQLNRQNNFDLRPLGKVQVKGKTEPVVIYECFNAGIAELFHKKKNTLSSFQKGIEHYFNRSFPQAFICFQQVIEENPEDITATLFLTKAARYISSGIPEGWNGVEEMADK